MRIKYVLIAFVTAALAANGTGGAETAENDGGSGGDAGGIIESALALTSVDAIVYGNLTYLDTVDWYERDAANTTAPTCVDASHSTAYSMTFRIAAVFGDNAREVTTGTPGGRTGVATPGYTGHMIEVKGPSTLDPLRPYSFRSAPVHAPANLPAWNDANTGSDASFRNPLPMGACVVGALQPNGYDQYDIYTFSGTAGRQVMLSMASTTGAGTLTLYAANGTTLKAVPASDFLTYTLPYTGSYNVGASQSSGPTLQYALGLCDPQCGPPSSPCRPTCIDMLRD